MKQPKDRNGNEVHVGSRVRLISLSGNWLNEIPEEEKEDVLSMIGEIFEVDEIDEYGQPWVTKYWGNEDSDQCHTHSVALASDEMELIMERTE